MPVFPGKFSISLLGVGASGQAVQCLACSVLASLAHRHMENQRLIADRGGLEAILFAMQTYKYQATEVTESLPG
jgi:hypothetical protein